MKCLKLVALLFCLLVCQGLAQEEVKTYLVSTEPLMQELQQNIKSFLNEVQPLREKKDLVGLKGVAENYIVVWDGMLDRLAEIKPPGEAEKHYQALKQLFELQRENNQILSETLAHQIALIQEIQKMREAGAGDEEVTEYAAANALDKDALLSRTSAVKTATKEADDTLKAEHERLTEMVAGDEEGEG